MKRLVIVTAVAAAVCATWWSMDHARETAHHEAPEQVARRQAQTSATPVAAEQEAAPPGSGARLQDRQMRGTAALAEQPLARQTERLRATAEKLRVRRDTAQQQGKPEAVLDAMDAHIDRIELQLEQDETSPVDE